VVAVGAHRLSIASTIVVRGLIAFISTRSL